MVEVKSKPHLHSEWIDSHSIMIVNDLQKQGFTCYLVGGCVRDLLVGIPPKDFDIVTDARPNQIRRNVRNAFVIGRRFRLVLVKRGEKQFEVATFRREFDPAESDEEAPEGDNLFGSPEEDAQRRDFTVNALFYDPSSQVIIDHSNGLEDLEKRTIRMIGDPDERLKEDPIRILRALRLAHKLGFTINAELRAAIPRQAPELKNTALPRRREELLKILRLDDPMLALREAQDLEVLQNISPTLLKVLEDPEQNAHFSSYINRMHSLVGDPNNAIELFVILALGFFRSAIDPNPRTPVKAVLLLENPLIKALFKEEFGLFNYEQKLIAQGLELQSSLLKLADDKEPSERLKTDLFSKDAFGVALLMALTDHLISPQQLFNWQQDYQRIIPEIERKREQRRQEASKRNRRRRPPRSSGTKE